MIGLLVLKAAEAKSMQRSYSSERIGSMTILVSAGANEDADDMPPFRWSTGRCLSEDAGESAGVSMPQLMWFRLPGSRLPGTVLYEW